MKVFTVLWVISLVFLQTAVQAQVLHSENFNVVIDSSKTLKGSFAPSFRYRNLKEDFLEIENTADVSLKIKNHAFTFANRISYSVLGKENILSGGFLYLEYVNLRSKNIAFEPFFQLHWNEVRGLESKYAAGSYFRWRAFVKNRTGIFVGAGALYEFEDWNYSGVPDNKVPTDPQNIEVNRARLCSYLSFKQGFGDLFDLDISFYYQPTISNLSQNYRLASSTELTYNVTQYIGLRVLYQNIYDSAPVVPIDQLYNDVNFGITITF